MSTESKDRLSELAWLFLRLGVLGFGGPAAHIALMEDEVVRRRQWLTRPEFLDLLGATNLIPGPNSTELAIHIGHRRAGIPGLIVAGVCFILPAALIVTGCAWLYVHFGTLPLMQDLLYGVKPVMIAVILQALIGLLGAAIKTRFLAVLAALTGFVQSLGVGIPIHLSFVGAGSGAWPLFVFFLKVGCVLYGSGYVLLAFLQDGLVATGLLTQNQLLDAIAIGQVTPGPVFTTATFVGYVLAGGIGALAATVGIFLPSFCFVWASAPFLPRMRQSVFFGRFLDAVNAISLALMAVVMLQLLKSAIVDLWTLALAVTSALMLLRWRLNTAWLILGGAAFGLVRAKF